MGIKLLKTHLRDIFVKNTCTLPANTCASPANSIVAASRNKPTVCVNLNQLHGKVIAVDACNFINRCYFSLMYGRRQEANSLMKTFFYRLFKLLSHNIFPLFVFDKNKQPNGIVRSTIDTQGVNESDMLVCRNILDAVGLIYFVSRTPAENTCKLLVDKNVAFAALTEDTDIFAMGCARVLTYANGRPSDFYMWNQSAILTSLGVTQSQFSHACVLMGTDCSEGVVWRRNNRTLTLLEALACIVQYKNITCFIMHQASLSGRSNFIITNERGLEMMAERYTNPAVVILQQDMMSFFRKDTEKQNIFARPVSMFPEDHQTGMESWTVRELSFKHPFLNLVKTMEDLEDVDFKKIKENVSNVKHKLMTTFKGFNKLIQMTGRANIDTTWRVTCQ